MNPATPQAEAAYRCVASKYRVETVEPGGVVPAGETFTLPIRFRGSVPRTS
jgi:hypothetical protein